jgi:trehalose 6-phosphate synthase
MGRLIVISNRVPKAGRAADAGGLAVALKGALTSTGGMWFGWSGNTAATEADCENLTRRSDGNVTYAVADLTERDVSEYYLGFSNRALWPLLHSRTDLFESRRQDFEGYMRVNRRFAQILAGQIRPDDLVWIHDYHLIPMAAELRSLGIRNRIGFFLHIPWPSPDIWTALPDHRDLLASFDAYDVIGLQTGYDAENFNACLDRQGLRGDIRSRVGAYPISIDTDSFAEVAAEAARHPIALRLDNGLGERKLIIGVDRLDYTKGIDKRLAAFERFLENSPAAKGGFVFLQVTPKSRSDVPEYAKIQRQLAEMSGRINGAFSDFDMVPLRYLNRTIRREALAGLYRLATVGLVTPLRDGMNLVAKEYVAAQPEDDPGVLVLSRFAGAAAEMDGAVLVNPYDIDGTAEAIRQAVDMPLDERRARWRRMFERLRTHDVVRWRESFLRKLAPQRPTLVHSAGRPPAGG